MATRMQQRRGTATQWISTNQGNGPILSPGEIGWESDTNKFKIGDGVNHWIDLDYFTTDSAQAVTDQINAAISGLVDGAPGLLDTLNELSAAINDDPTFFSTIATNLSNHESDTTNVHGILDTNELATKEYVTQEIGNATVDQSALAGVGIDWNAVTEAFDIDSTVATKTYVDDAVAAVDLSSKQDVVSGVSSTEIGYLDGVTSAIQDQLNDKASLTGTENLSNKTLVDPTIEINYGSGQHTITSTELRFLDGVTSSIQNQLDSKLSTSTASSTYQPLVSGVSDTEIGYLDGVTSSIQTQLDSKSTASKTETLTNKTIANPTVTATVSGGSTPEVVTAASTYGTVFTVGSGAVTSGQMKIDFFSTPTLSGNSIYVDTDYLTNASATISLDSYGAGATFAGTVTGYLNPSSGPITFTATNASAFDSAIDSIFGGFSVNEESVGIVFNSGNNIPSTVTKTISSTEISYLDGVTSAIQTQLDAKAPLASPTFTGTASVDDLAIAGSLTFSGTATQINSTETTLEDPIIYLAEGNTANINDLGFVASYDDGTYAHTGLVKDSSAGTWKLFKGVTDEPTNTVNFGQGTLDDLQVGGLTASSLTVGDVSNTEFSYLNGVTSAIQTQLNAKQPIVSGVSDTEIGYLDGVTSAIQTQLNAKAPAANPTFTGTVDFTGATVNGISSYEAPTLGTTSIASGATVTTIAGLTLTAPVINLATSAQTASYTLVLADNGKLVEINNASANTLTVPTNASVAFPIGAQINILQTGSGQITVGGAGVTINGTPGLKLRTQWSSATLIKRGTDTWVLIGDLSA